MIICANKILRQLSTQLINNKKAKQKIKIQEIKKNYNINNNKSHNNNNNIIRNQSVISLKNYRKNLKKVQERRNQIKNLSLYKT